MCWQNMKDINVVFVSGYVASTIKLGYLNSTLIANVYVPHSSINSMLLCSLCTMYVTVCR